jgi:hypothetical protein
MIARLGRKEDELRFLPLHAGKVELAVFVDAGTGDFLKISSLSAWGED